MKKSVWVANTLFLFMLLVFLCLTAYLIYNQIHEYYAQLDPILPVIRKHIAPLDPVVEDLQFYEGNKSYTINKQKIYLCLRDENKNYYDFNMLVYVAIHELAHVLCDEIGHTAKFHMIFEELLQKASKMGIYDPSKPIIQDYCSN